jgi:hypothetical protein
MSQSQEIQFLINEIDNVLPKSSSDPLKLKPEDIAGQHRVLEKVQSYLRSRLRQPTAISEPSSSLNPTEQEAAWRIAQAVMARIDRSTGYTSNSQEVEVLEQQRDELQREIRRLQTQHEKLISEAVQSLTNRLQTSLQRQFSQDLPRQPHLGESNISVEAEYIEQLKQHSDQMLLSLDSTLQSVFKALEQDVHTYKQSLTEGLQQIHNLGQQSEVVLSGYLKRLRENKALKGSDELLSQGHADADDRSSSLFTGDLATENLRDQEEGLSPNMFPFAGAELQEFEATYLDSNEAKATQSPENLPDNAQIDELMSLDLEIDVADNLETQVEEQDSLASPEGNWYDDNLVQPEKPDTTTAERPIQSQGYSEYSSHLNAEMPVETELYEAISDPAQAEERLQDRETKERMNWSEVLFEDDLANAKQDLYTPEGSSAPETVDTIRQLTDLLVETHWYRPQASPLETREEVLSSPSNPDEDFIPAAPNENLLAQENTTSEIPANLEGLLDQSILQQLSEDLERFENIQGDRSEMGEEETTTSSETSAQEMGFYVTEEGSEPSPWEESSDTFSQGFEVGWQENPDEGES